MVQLSSHPPAHFDTGPSLEEQSKNSGLQGEGEGRVWVGEENKTVDKTSAPAFFAACISFFAFPNEPSCTDPISAIILTINY